MHGVLCNAVVDEETKRAVRCILESASTHEEDFFFFSLVAARKTLVLLQYQVPGTDWYSLSSRTSQRMGKAGRTRKPRTQAQSASKKHRFTIAGTANVDGEKRRSSEGG